MTYLISPFSYKWFLGQTFTHVSDELPEGRPKLLHTYGSTALIEFQVDPRSSSYTGLFQTGGIGLIRLSLAKQPDSSDDNYIPGFAMKLLVDGKASINFHVMNSLEGQGKDRNYFARTFTNIVEPPKSGLLKFLSWFFSNAVQALSDESAEKPENEMTLPLVEAASIQANGTAVSGVIYPRRIIFTPNPKVAIASDSEKDFRIEFENIAEGTVLYEVSVKKDEDSNAEPIGRIVTRSKFIASKYGDQKLFFQHMKRSGLVKRAEEVN